MACMDKTYRNIFSGVFFKVFLESLSEIEQAGMDEFFLDKNGEFYVTENVRASFDK